jgi:DnaJ domain/PilZ domain
MRLFWFGPGGSSGRQAMRPRKNKRYSAELLQTPLGQVIDLSTSGLRVRGTGKPAIKAGEAIPVKLQTPQGELNFLGRVAWVRRLKGGFEAGFELLDVKPHIASRLRQIAEFGFIPDAPPPVEPASVETGFSSGKLRKSATSTNPYEILEVEATATDEQIQKAYRKLARIYHPDVNKSPDAVAKFERIVAAYRSLQKVRLSFGS